MFYTTPNVLHNTGCYTDNSQKLAVGKFCCGHKHSKRNSQAHLLRIKRLTNLHLLPESQ